MIKKFKILNLIIGVWFTFSFISCKDLISINDPIDRISGNSVFSIDETAIAMVTNIYTQLRQDCNSFNGDGMLMNISLYGGLSADELSLYGSSNLSYYRLYTNSLNADNAMSTWSNIYNKLFAINSAIIGITSSNTLSNNVHNQLLGEAKFMRAFCYFYLVNLYGDVPLVLNTDPLVNSSLSRASKDKVYIQILDDLKDAQSLLSENYLDGNLAGVTTERVRPTKWAATALLARTYLFLSDYVNAEKEASALISNQGLYSLDSLNGVFLKNSNECIWQVQNVYNTGANTGDGQVFVLPSSGPNGDTYPVYLSNFIIDDFEDGDMRKTNWIGSITTTTGVTYYFPYKYKSGSLTSAGTSKEYVMMLRLGEQYLIRAEAFLQLGKIELALSDINKIRNRAGLNDIKTNSKDSLLSIILHERKMELFSEWGHRWLDLRRTGNINQVMKIVTQQKGGIWQQYSEFYPIATSELLANSHLIQNSGY